MENFTIFTRPDLSYNSFLPWRLVNSNYNTILTINKSFNIGDKLTINSGYQKFIQTAVLKSNIISIMGNTFHYTHIAPGLPINLSSNLLLNDQEPLNTFIDNSTTNKLINGIIILDNNYYHSFNINDNIELNINNNINKYKIIDIYNKYNFYKANTFVTILDILDNNNLNAIYDLNGLGGKYNKVYVRSYDTRLNQEKGSIVIKSFDKKIYDAEIIGIDNKYKYKYKLLSRLEIKNISKGKYKIIINNDNNLLVKEIEVVVDEFIDRQPSKKLVKLPLFSR